MNYSKIDLPTVVYAVQGALTGLIRVGATNRLDEQMKLFEQCSPDPVRLLRTLPGGRQNAEAINEQFRHLRRYGLWMEPKKELLEFIQNLTPEMIGQSAMIQRPHLSLERLPVYFRMPKPGSSDPYFECTRSWWNDRVLSCETNNHNPPVRSVSLRNVGSSRGIRLICMESALAYFDAAALEQAEVRR